MPFVCQSAFTRADEGLLALPRVEENRIVNQYSRNLCHHSWHQIRCRLWPVQNQNLQELNRRRRTQGHAHLEELRHPTGRKSRSWTSRWQMLQDLHRGVPSKFRWKYHTRDPPVQSQRHHTKLKSDGNRRRQQNGFHWQARLAKFSHGFRNANQIRRSRPANSWIDNPRQRDVDPTNRASVLKAAGDGPETRVLANSLLDFSHCSYAFSRKRVL